MAGGISKTLGALLLIVGVLLLVAGGIAAAYGFTQEEERKEDPLSPVTGENGSEDENQQVMFAGLAAAGLGLVAIIISIVFFIIGGARSQSALRKAMLQAVRPSAPVAPLPVAADGAPGEPAPVATPADRKRKTIVAAAIVAGGVLLVAVLALVLGGGDGDGGGLFGADEEGSDPVLLKQETFDGTVHGGEAPVIGTVNAPVDENARSFSPPPAATGFQALLEWTPDDVGTDHLMITVSYRMLDTDEWSPIGQADGGSPLVVSGEFPAGATVRVAVAAAGDAPAAQQPFRVTLAFLG